MSCCKSRSPSFTLRPFSSKELPTNNYTIVGHFCLTQNTSSGQSVRILQLPGLDFVRVAAAWGSPTQSFTLPPLLSQVSDLLCCLKALPHLLLLPFSSLSFTCVSPIYLLHIWYWLDVCYQRAQLTQIVKKQSEKGGSKIRFRTVLSCVAGKENLILSGI